MFQRVFKGDKWAWLECVDIKDKQVFVPWPRGGGGELETQTFVVLQCTCGNKIQIEDVEFPGKRKMPDCGCGGGRDEQRKAIKTLMLPVSFITEIENYANANYKGNFSKALVELMRPVLVAEKAKLGPKPILVDSQVAQK